MDQEMSGGSRSLVSRRQFLACSGALASLGLLAQVSGLVKAEDWFDPAHAQDVDLVRDTFNGLVAFVLPGDDPYSIAQGEWADGPGGIAARTTDALIVNLDRFVPRPDTAGANDDTVPLSGAVASLLNTVALSVNPAAGGPFPSPFARLSFSEKAQVFRVLESSGAPDGQLPQPFTRSSGNFAFLVGVLPAFLSFLAASEQGVFDPGSRSLTGRPVSWQISGYQPHGRVEGWDEYKGFYQGHRKADS